VSHTAAENAVEKYLKDLNEIYRTGGGVDEESYYTPLENLINEVAGSIQPATLPSQAATKRTTREVQLYLLLQLIPQDL